MDPRSARPAAPGARRSCARFLLATAVAAAFAVSAGCGGGGGDGGAGLPTDLYLTADPRGLTAAPGFPLPDGAAAGDGAAAAETAEDLAREIQEADLYRLDGDTLYLCNVHRGLAVIDLDGMRLLGRLPTVGVPHEMFLLPGRALVFLTRPDGGCELLDVSLAPPAAPTLAATIDLGTAPFLTSRLAGDLVHVVTTQAVRTFRVGVSVVPTGSAALPLGAAHVHATADLLAVASPGDGLQTFVTLVDLSAATGVPARRGSVALPGSVADDEKLHLGAGTLRVVTHDAVDGGLSHVFVVGLADLDAPRVLGTLDLARGEQTFATRFTDEAAYVVTFEQVDPLWVVDLRVPTAPTLRGALVTPGWSTHLVPVPGGRLVALGVDPTDGWHVIASLFDVSDPSSPALLDREDFGWGWSSAFEDLRGLGVFPAEGRVFVPLAGEADRVAVLDLGSSSLALRGSIPVAGTALRGFPHSRGLVAVSTEEVVLADPASLADLGRLVLAENVVDAARLPDGRILALAARGERSTVGGVTIPLSADRLHLHGTSAAVTGWDAAGRAVFVVDFGASPPTVSGRFDLGEAPWTLGTPRFGWAAGDVLAPEGIALGTGEAVLTPGGRLVVHGRPPGGTDDGFLVLDVSRQAWEAPIRVPTGFVTGFVTEGESLAFTVGTGVGPDDAGRPWMRHDLVRIDLPTRAATEPVNVPGWVLAIRGDRVFTAEETWDLDGSCSLSIAASRLATDAAVLLGREPLPGGAYDLKAAGRTLFFTESAWSGPLPLPGDGGGVGGSPGGGVDDGVATPAWGAGDVPWVPRTSIATLRLEDDLPRGPVLEGTGFTTLLLPEDGAALTVRDGLTVERWDLSGATAVRTWERPTGAYPLAARPDPASAGYLLALGYAGVLQVP